MTSSRPTAPPRERQPRCGRTHAKKRVAPSVPSDRTRTRLQTTTSITCQPVRSVTAHCDFTRLDRPGSRSHPRRWRRVVLGSACPAASCTCRFAFADAWTPLGADEVVGPRERPKEGTTPVVKRPTSAAGFFTLNPGSSVQGLPPRTRNQGYADLARPERVLCRRRRRPQDEALRRGLHISIASRVPSVNSNHENERQRPC